MVPNPEYWEGKRGACVGAIVSCVSKRNIGVPPNGLKDIYSLLHDSVNPQAETLMKVISRYMKNIY